MIYVTFYIIYARFQGNLYRMDIFLRIETVFCTSSFRVGSNNSF